MFKTGDVVVLKSGGPAMTVIGAMGETGVTCSWFEQHSTVTCGGNLWRGLPASAQFPAVALKLFKESDDAPI